MKRHHFLLPLCVKHKCLMKQFTLIFLCIFFLVHNSDAQKKIIVDKNGKGEYKTLQSALDAIPSHNEQLTVIYIKKGIYKEKIIVDATKNNITLIGEDKANTIFTYNDHAGTKLENGDTLNTWTCASFVVYGNNFHAEHVSFE